MTQKIAPRINPPVVKEGTRHYLTSYYWSDDSRYTIREHDKRLRWSIDYGPSGRPAQYVTATVEYWTRNGWTEVWTTEPVSENCRAVAVHRILFRELAKKANEILL